MGTFDVTEKFGEVVLDDGRVGLEALIAIREVFAFLDVLVDFANDWGGKLLIFCDFDAEIQEYELTNVLFIVERNDRKLRLLTK